MIIKDLFEKDNLAQHLVMCVITAHAHDVADGNVHKVPGWEELSGKELDISLHINGVEVPFGPAVERMQSERERWIKERAGEMFEEKLPGVSEIIQQLADACDAVRDEVKQRFGTEISEDAEYFPDRFPCQPCGGTGFLYPHDALSGPCGSCGGTGRTFPHPGVKLPPPNPPKKR